MTVKPVPGPDGLEKGIRIGCGGIVGAFVGLALYARFFFRWVRDPWIAVAIILFVAALCAWGALRGGDRFWQAGFASRGTYRKPWNRPPGPGS